jgi:hypothetical protein
LTPEIRAELLLYQGFEPLFVDALSLLSVFYEFVGIFGREKLPDLHLIPDALHLSHLVCRIHPERVLHVGE